MECTLKRYHFSVHAQSVLDSTAYEPLFKNLDEKPAFQKDGFQPHFCQISKIPTLAWPSQLECTLYFLLEKDNFLGMSLLLCPGKMFVQVN